MEPKMFHVKQSAATRELPPVPVSHPSADMVASVRSLLEAGAVPCTDDQAATMAAHLQFVLDANAIAQLTAIKTYEQGLVQHVLDSCLAYLEVSAAPEGPIVDLGSGGGFPGLPLSVLTGRPVLLVDSVGKKARLVQQFIDQTPSLRQRAMAYAGRAEALAKTEARDQAGVVVARALAPLSALVELAAPLLKPGGWLVALKGEPSNDEFARGDATARIIGMERLGVREYTLGDTGARRCVVIYRRIGVLKRQLPRKEGLAQHQPLA